MRVLYEGVDIYPDISVNRCLHTMYAAGHADELILKLNDVRGLWDGWGPKPGESLAVEEGAATTGAMTIDAVVPESGSLTLLARSVPPAAFEAQSKSWDDVWLHQLCHEIAGRLGLGLEIHDVPDRNYRHVEQRNLPDLEFLSQRCALEGAAFLVFDGRLVVYGEKAREESAAEQALNVAQGSRFSYKDTANRMYGRMEVGNGLYTGRFIADATNARVLRRQVAIFISDQGEADRFAMNLLRSENRQHRCGCIWSERPLYGFAPGGMCQLETENVAAFDGPGFLEKVRHDYAKGKSTAWFRKPLEGY